MVLHFCPRLCRSLLPASVSGATSLSVPDSLKPLCIFLSIFPHSFSYSSLNTSVILESSWPWSSSLTPRFSLQGPSLRSLRQSSTLVPHWSDSCWSCCSPHLQWSLSFPVTSCVPFEQLFKITVHQGSERKRSLFWIIVLETGKSKPWWKQLISIKSEWWMNEWLKERKKENMNENSTNPCSQTPH